MNGGEAMNAPQSEGVSKKYMLFCNKCHKAFESGYKPQHNSEIICPKCSEKLKDESADEMGPSLNNFFFGESNEESGGQ